jgi:hypothetical protein
MLLLSFYVLVERDASINTGSESQTDVHNDLPEAACKTNATIMTMT